MNNNTLSNVVLREVNQINPATGRIEPYIVVSFKVGTHGPFTESFLKSTFDPAGMNARLMDFTNKLGLIQGQ